jgi:hypothetical protein
MTRTLYAGMGPPLVSTIDGPRFASTHVRMRRFPGKENTMPQSRIAIISRALASLAFMMIASGLILGTAPRYASADSLFFWEGDTIAARVTDGRIRITPNEAHDRMVKIELPDGVGLKCPCSDNAFRAEFAEPFAVDLPVVADRFALVQYKATTTTGADVSIFVKARIATNKVIMMGTLDVAFAQLCFVGPDDPTPSAELCRGKYHFENNLFVID